MRIMTLLGTRPEIIRLSIIMKELKKYSHHVLVHTGQNYANSLNEIFFDNLGLKKPDHNLGIKAGSFGSQIGQIIEKVEKVLLKEKPDKLLILGDTNSGLGAICAKRLAIPVYHMEAGNRCYDDRVPEEINRRIIDHSSDILMPYTHRSKENLVREGIDRKKIFVIGNPIFEVISAYEPQIEKSKIFNSLNLSKGKYFLVTMHRAENVDIEKRLRNFVCALDGIGARYKMPIICSLHPHTLSKMKKFGISLRHKYIRYLIPFGFFDFIALERNAFCVLSDSGTVQEECCIFNIPNITIRDVTERPETIECGSNVISGDSPDHIISLVELVHNSNTRWNIPSEYTETNVANKVVKIMLSKN